jgi:hypothetical protein
MEENEENKEIGMDFETLINTSEKFKRMRKECVVAVGLSLTGITNLIVNHEDQALVDVFLKSCYKERELYHETHDIDAVELQQGEPGRGRALGSLDELIFGTLQEEESKKNELIAEPTYKIDEKTGKRLRNPDGFVSRKENLLGIPKDSILIIRNLDYCLDFCKDEPGVIDARALYIFDNFRHPHIKRNCSLLLVTNKKIKLPFKIRHVKIEPVDEFEANHILNSAMDLFIKYSIDVKFTDSQKQQIIRKIIGLTYTEASDVLCEVLSSCRIKKGNKQEIDSRLSIKKMRSKINSNFMEDASGLTHLSSRPWEDYICPESSNFTYDVKKILRDFKEINLLKEDQDKLVKENKEDIEEFKSKSDDMIAIRSRMPHVIVLYGKGGIGKCLGKGTKVMMFDGSIKNVEDIVKGDLLMGPDFKPRTVLSTTSGIGPLYRVDQKNGDSYICNDAHILSLQKKSSLSGTSPIFISINDYLKKNKTWKKIHYGWKVVGNLSRISTKLPRKQWYDNPQKRSLKCGISVNPIGEGEYFGFSIDGDKQFLLGDFTVTHNSAFPLHFAGLLEFDIWDFNINACHSKWIGEGPERMREALIKINKATHLVVRVDEYDRAMGANDSAGQGMHSAFKQVESEFMNWLQNNQEDNIFIKNDIFVVLTTNHKENITGPLLRSGRADLVIDIADFDEKSLKETFLTAARRMKNRGVNVLGFKNTSEFNKAILDLDLDKLSPIAVRKGFTVRDIDTLLQEMAAHNYYFKRGKSNISWNTEMFIKVLENSTGSAKTENTCELVLGDRILMENKKTEDQYQFPFVNDKPQDDKELPFFNFK